MDELELNVTKADNAARATEKSVREHFQPTLDRLEGFAVELNPDPVVVGLDQFNQKLALLRANANVANTFLARAIAMRADWRVKSANLERAYEEKLNNLIVLDP